MKFSNFAITFSLQSTRKKNGEKDQSLKYSIGFQLLLWEMENDSNSRSQLINSLEKEKKRKEWKLVPWSLEGSYVCTGARQIQKHWFRSSVSWTWGRTVFDGSQTQTKGKKIVPEKSRAKIAFCVPWGENVPAFRGKIRAESADPRKWTKKCFLGKEPWEENLLGKFVLLHPTRLQAWKRRGFLHPERTIGTITVTWGGP